MFIRLATVVDVIKRFLQEIWKIQVSLKLNFLRQGSGCDSVGRAAAFDLRGLRFESRLYIEHLNSANCIEKTKKKKKRPGMRIAHFKKKFLNQILMIFFYRSIWK